MNELFWDLVADFLAAPQRVDWLIRRAQRTPYQHLEGYMNRWWLFNPYKKSHGKESKRFPRLPSIRIHHILREDLSRDFHDHPWNARTIILKGWYVEDRLVGDAPNKPVEIEYFRGAGDTARLLYGQYHRIKEVSPGGVWTIFITWEYKGVWGFLVNGKKVPWPEYLEEN